jgi:hypothetical protein
MTERGAHADIPEPSDGLRSFGDCNTGAVMAIQHPEGCRFIDGISKVRNSRLDHPAHRAADVGKKSETQNRRPKGKLAIVDTANKFVILKCPKQAQGRGHRQASRPGKLRERSATYSQRRQKRERPFHRAVQVGTNL